MPLVAVELRRQVVFLFERAVAGHVVEHLEFAFRAVEQSGEHQGQIEVGEAKPFDAALFGDERGGPAITDDTVIEIIFHRRFSCWSAGSSRLSRRSAPPSYERVADRSDGMAVLDERREPRQYVGLPRQIVAGIFRSGAGFHRDGRPGQGLEHVVVDRVVADCENEVVTLLTQQTADLRTFGIFGRLDLHDLAIRPGTPCKMRRVRRPGRRPVCRTIGPGAHGRDRC